MRSIWSNYIIIDGTIKITECFFGICNEKYLDNDILNVMQSLLILILKGELLNILSCNSLSKHLFVYTSEELIVNRITFTWHFSFCKLIVYH